MTMLDGMRVKVSLITGKTVFGYLREIAYHLPGLILSCPLIEGHETRIFEKFFPWQMIAEVEWYVPHGPRTNPEDYPYGEV